MRLLHLFVFTVCSEHLSKRKNIKFMNDIHQFVFYFLHHWSATGLTLIYLKNSAHFCLGVRSRQLTRSQEVAEVARVSQVQAMLELSQSTQTEAGAQVPVPVHLSSPPCSWALSGA